VINLGMTILAIRLVDRVGRKPMLLAGVAGMAVLDFPGGSGAGAPEIDELSVSAKMSSDRSP
jgi:MFS family permease